MTGNKNPAWKAGFLQLLAGVRDPDRLCAVEIGHVDRDDDGAGRWAA